MAEVIREGTPVVVALSDVEANRSDTNKFREVMQSTKALGIKRCIAKECGLAMARVTDEAEQQLVTLECKFKRQCADPTIPRQAADWAILGLKNRIRH